MNFCVLITLSRRLCSSWIRSQINKSISPEIYLNAIKPTSVKLYKYLYHLVMFLLFPYEEIWGFLLPYLANGRWNWSKWSSDLKKPIKFDQSLWLGPFWSIYSPIQLPSVFSTRFPPSLLMNISLSFNYVILFAPYEIVQEFLLACSAHRPMRMIETI